MLLEKKLESLEFSAIDIETTGLNPTQDEILEIGVIRFQKNCQVAQFQQLIQPSKPIPEETSKIHGIEAETVQRAPTIDEVLPSLINFVQNSILVIQNSIFDLSFLIHRAKMAQLSFPTLPVFCTLQLTRRYYPHLKRYRLSFLKEYFKIETYKFRTPTDSPYHEALNDAFIAMNVFKVCLQERNLWGKNFLEVVFHEKGLKYISDYDNYLF
ncbi:MAG: 3'-5' exonuclease [Leptospiraceae bacterium]|nr:3'-5' exonuclease [Leptospiraceae bacterium]